MVAIIRCSRAEADHISWADGVRSSRQEERTWTTTRPQKDWRNGAHLTLLVTGNPGGEVISALGWTTRIRRADDLGEKLEVCRIESLTTPVPLQEAHGSSGDRPTCARAKNPLGHR